MEIRRSIDTIGASWHCQTNGQIAIQSLGQKPSATAKLRRIVEESSDSTFAGKMIFGNFTFGHAAAVKVVDIYPDSTRTDYIFTAKAAAGMENREQEFHFRKTYHGSGRARTYSASRLVTVTRKTGLAFSAASMSYVCEILDES